MNKVLEEKYQFLVIFEQLKFVNEMQVLSSGIKTR